MVSSTTFVIYALKWFLYNKVLTKMCQNCKKYLWRIFVPYRAPALVALEKWQYPIWNLQNLLYNRWKFPSWYLQWFLRTLWTNWHSGEKMKIKKNSISYVPSEVMKIGRRNFQVSGNIYYPKEFHKITKIDRNVYEKSHPQNL